MRDAHRKARLAHLLQTDYTSRQDFLSKNDWCSKARLSQALGEKQPFAEDAAASWEERLGLQPGWFNGDAPTPKEARRSGKTSAAAKDSAQAAMWPFPDEVLRAVVALNATDRAYAENALRSFLRLPPIPVPLGEMSASSARSSPTGTHG